jgi:cytochrome c-type biogenesis protein CcsB
MLFTTGSRRYDGWNPVELLLSWMVSADEWGQKDFIQVSNADAKKQLGIELTQSRFSPDKLLRDSYLTQYASEVQQKAPPSKTNIHADPREKEVRAVIERIGVFRGVVSGEAWPMIPSEKEGGTWTALSDSRTMGGPVPNKFRDVVLAYRDGDRARFESAVRELSSVTIKSTALSAEVFYNQSHLFLYAWILYAISGILWLANRKGSLKFAAVLTPVALTLHIAGMALRSYIAGRPPVTNMYESIVWVAFGVVIFAYVLKWLQKQSLPLMVACFLAALGLVAADSAPAVMDSTIQPLVPVLRSNYWLTIHVLTITISYAAFALAFGISTITLWQFIRNKPGLTARVANLNLLSYRVMQFGVVLVAAGTILGGVWADYSWGRFWGWDPKEVWALIVLMTYLVILHGRYAGWVGQFGFAVWSVVSFLTVLMAWYGVNFILGVGLHSYGFTQGGRGAVFSFVGVLLVYVLFAVYFNRANRKRQN